MKRVGKGIRVRIGEMFLGGDGSEVREGEGGKRKRKMGRVNRRRRERMEGKRKG